MGRGNDTCEYNSRFQSQSIADNQTQIALEKLETKGCMLHPFIDPTVTPKYAETGAHVGAILLEKSKIDQKARDMGPLQRLPIFEKALRASIPMVYQRLQRLTHHRKIRSFASVS